jgi:hypothetical protein
MMILSVGKKYRGKALADVPLGYLLWLVEESPFRDRNGRLWEALAAEARRRLGVVLAEHRCDDLERDYRAIEREVADYRVLLRGMKEELLHRPGGKTRRRQAAAPGPPVEQALGCAFEKEPAAVVAQAVKDLMASAACCSTCRARVLTFFDGWLGAYLRSN